MALIYPPPWFTSGQPLEKEVTAKKLNDVSQAGIFEVVGGRLEVVPGKGRRIIIDPQGRRSIRACVVTGSSQVSLDGGGTFTFSTLTSDVDTTDAADQVLVELSGTNVVFRAAGLYRVTYHGVIELDIGGATDVNPGVCEAKTNLTQAGTDLTATEAYFGAPIIPNFSYLLENSSPGGSFDPYTDIDTIDGYTPVGTVKGTVSGACLIRVIHDSADSGNLKILDGVTTYSPYLTLSGARNSTGGQTYLNSATLTIQLQ